MFYALVLFVTTAAAQTPPFEVLLAVSAAGSAFTHSSSPIFQDIISKFIAKNEA